MKRKGYTFLFLTVVVGPFSFSLLKCYRTTRQSISEQGWLLNSPVVASNPYELIYIEKFSLRDYTEKCRPEITDPFHPDIVKSVVNKAPPLRCDHDFLTEITFIQNHQLKVDISKLDVRIGNSKFSHCRYRSIIGLPNDDQKIGYSVWSKPFYNSISLQKNSEFIQVKCYSDSLEKSVISKSFFSLVPKRPHLDKLYDVKLNKRQVEYQPMETLNIVIVGVDGLSRHQFMRTMPKTYQYLTDVLGTFDFKMQGQHGGNTFSNFLPLLSGNLESDVKNWWDPSQPQDAFDFIFDNFEKAGYRTMYSEDNPFGSGLYFDDHYLIKPLTSYWHRPLHIAMLSEDGFESASGSCLGARPVSEFQFDYMLKFLSTFPDKPVFGLSFFDAVTHYDTGSAGMLDEHLLSFYKSLSVRGHMNNSLVMLFSDHGARWGKVRQSPHGRFDGRNPFLFLTFPPWFLHRHPDVLQNLKANTCVLTSFLDIHQMLLDLLYFKSKFKAPITRSSKGVSLLNSLPERSCGEAYIPDNECLCRRWDETPIDVSAPIAQQVSNVLLQEVKSRSDRAKCFEYSLRKVISVKLLLGYTVNFDRDETPIENKHYLVRLMTFPGQAIFEGIVHHDPSSERRTEVTEIERLDLYRGEVHCLPNLRQIYCYCKDNISGKL
ncbi:hypothetical protein RRG08_034418 [Elysia crispata]|uniref:Uncharacterized protein n=1 Tax=Elysia crispata TaxID=231223 RepID=A0AAE0YEM5_9GAST|nr:hypothetical protein RRG08_034418 [Elysia crispata]